MRFIGITGGVGAGKSEVLSYLETTYGATVLRADDIAHELTEPEGECYPALKLLFAKRDDREELFAAESDEPDETGTDRPINRRALARAIFADDEFRNDVNGIIHPEVKREVMRRVDEARQSGAQWLFLEAALLLEEHYDELCDEIWYVHASRKIRIRRLKETRHYSSRKIEKILRSQKTDEEFREKCARVIENAGTLEEMYASVDEAVQGVVSDEDGMENREDGEKTVIEAVEKQEEAKQTEIDATMETETQAKSNVKSESETQDNADKKSDGKDYVFGLDIGTRNVVGTVGYPLDGSDNGFYVLAQCSMEHESRAMLDGQIHDIGRVAKVVQSVKEELERQIDMKLTDVCIAAAGRVLRTITTRVKMTYPEESVVTDEDLHTLDLLGIDKAQQELKEAGENKYKFYCVGYSVMKYYLNGDLMSNIEGHKAEEIEEDIIVTFLPEDVVDGLYSAVERAGLRVANLTLEPIAAINVAIPENFRLLNIALVDVGAGTSDLCITKDGSITAYGMIPSAGDELTECIVQEFLVDFATAEQVKKGSVDDDKITYEDIMGLSHTIDAKEVWKLTDPVRDKITGEVAGKIKELNGGKSVSAVFVVGGGGKVHGFCESLAKKLGIAKERVALRGEEVMKNITFAQPDVKKDPLLVTPIGICLNYYEQKNNFIMIRFNGEMMKLYDNGHLTVFDAAMQAGFQTEELFPRRGREIRFTVNGKQRLLRGEEGESAVILMNGMTVGMNEKLIPNSEVEITASTAGVQGTRTIESLEEYNSSTVTFVVNNHLVTCPKFVEVNGSLEPGTYEIKEGDNIETRNFYTVGQLREFMDVEIDPEKDIYVNNRVASLETLVYENFNIEWTALNFASLDDDYKKVEDSPLMQMEQGEAAENVDTDEKAEDVAADGQDEQDEQATEDEVAADGQETEDIVTDETVEQVTDALADETAQQGEPTAESDVSDVDEAEKTDDAEVTDSAEPTDSTEPTDSDEAETENDADNADVPDNTETPSNAKDDNDTPENSDVEEREDPTPAGKTIKVYVNGALKELSGKNEYIFVDVFDTIGFDPKSGNGRTLTTKRNGMKCGYAAALLDGDHIEVFWNDKLNFNK